MHYREVANCMTGYELPTKIKIGFKNLKSKLPCSHVFHCSALEARTELRKDFVRFLEEIKTR